MGPSKWVNERALAKTDKGSDPFVPLLPVGVFLVLDDGLMGGSVMATSNFSIALFHLPVPVSHRPWTPTLASSRYTSKMAAPHVRPPPAAIRLLPNELVLDVVQYHLDHKDMVTVRNLAIDNARFAALLAPYTHEIVVFRVTEELGVNWMRTFERFSESITLTTVKCVDPSPYPLSSICTPEYI
jgi:hypothetical protein